MDEGLNFLLTSASQLPTAVGDVNADGYDDILLNQFYPASNGQLLLGDATNTFATSISVQGLPNRTTLYQQGAAGDINGDGYDDLLMSDFNYQLTYAIYGQDWLTANEQNSSNSTFFDGTNGNDVFTIPSNVTSSKIVLRGKNGDDFMLIPTANTSQIYAFGGEGDDQIGLGGEFGTDSKTIGKIDGGGGFDTIFIPQTIGQQTRLYLDANA
ncbi:MAG: FG-GAP repeat domain-containing protein, partial [Microcystis sp.]